MKREVTDYIRNRITVFVVISNQNNTSFDLPQPDGSILESDSLTTFKLQDDGSLVWHLPRPPGGSFPREFSIGKKGSFIVFANQNIQNVAVLQRDTATSLIGEPVARVTIGNNMTCVG